MFVSTLSLVGFTQGVPRYLSRYESEADLRGVWVSGLGVAGVVSVAAAAGIFVGAELIADALMGRPNAATLLRLFALAIPLVVGMQIGVGAVRGHEITVYKTYVQDLLYPLSRIVLVGVLLWAGVGMLAAGYAYFVAAALSFVVIHVFLNRVQSLRGSFTLHTREMLRFSAPLVFATVLSMLLSKTDTLMLGYFKSSQQVGLYGYAYTLGGGMLIVLSAFGFMYLPIASRLDADGEREELDLIYKTTTKWVYMLTFPAFLTFVLFPGDVLQIVFGENAAAAASTLAILAFGFFTSAAAGRNRETLSAIGETDYLLVANGAAFVLNFLLNLVLIPRFGATGAAVTSTVSFIVVHAVVCGILYVQFDITPLSSESIRTFVLLPVVLLPPAALLSQYIELTAITLLPFLVLVGLLGVGVVALGGGLQPEDGVVIGFIEDQIGVRIPLLHRYIPGRPVGADVVHE
jgi:O-antigen/teichoic acid export membrane protein